MRDWIVELVRATGVFGIGLLMFLENVFPPLPSEIIMPLGGYLASRGRMSLWGAVAAGALGSLLGTLVWYLAGRRTSEERVRHWVRRHGVWLAMREADVDRAQRWFRGHGPAVVFFGRLLPVIRTLISLPAGFSRMPLPRFLLYSMLGTCLWTGALGLAGHALGARFQQVDRYVGPVTWVVVGAALVAYVFRVVRLLRERRAGSAR